MKKLNQILSMFLVLALVIGFVPVMGQAAMDDVAFVDLSAV